MGFVGWVRSLMDWQRLKVAPSCADVGSHPHIKKKWWQSAFEYPKIENVLHKHDSSLWWGYKNFPPYVTCHQNTFFCCFPFRKWGSPQTLSYCPVNTYWGLYSIASKHHDMPSYPFFVFWTSSALLARNTRNSDQVYLSSGYEPDKITLKN